MTNEEKEAIENIKEDIKYADLRDLVDDDCTVCFVEDLETILNLLEKQDNRIKELESDKEIKDKTIKLMSEHLTTPIHSKKDVIEYFENLAKESGEIDEG